MAIIPPEHRGPAEQYFLKVMAEEVENGYTPGATFRIESQLRVNRKFRVVYGPIFSDRFLKSKLKNIKKRYIEFSELLNKEGIQWNMENNVVHGNEKLLREQYRHRYKYGCYFGEPNFDLMRQIFESGVKFE